MKFRMGKANDKFVVADSNRSGRSLTSIMQMLSGLEEDELALHLVGMGYLQGVELWNASSGSYCIR
jgi:hypothetical protein